MIIALKKFGTTLISRQLGKEAFLAYGPTLKDVSTDEKVEIDFDGVVTLAPSWGDEFITPLFDMYKERLFLKNTENISVKTTLELLEEVSRVKFNIV